MKHGGKRKGAGAPKIFKEETTTIAVRVPISKSEEVKKIIDELRKKWKLTKELNLNQ